MKELNIENTNNIILLLDSLLNPKYDTIWNDLKQLINNRN